MLQSAGWRDAATDLNRHANRRIKIIIALESPVPAFHELLLTTPRLHLRPLTPADAPALYATFADPETTRYWSTSPWTSIEEAQKLIAKDMNALPACEYLRLGLERRDNGKLIGMCSLFQWVRQCRRVELGYGMHRAHWGRGLMHEALSELLRFGFDALDLNRVEADVDPRNGASVRSLERLGFVKEGHLRERWIVDGEVSDTSLYGLLRRDWLASREIATNDDVLTCAPEGAPK